MNPTFHRPISIEAAPTISSVGLDKTDQFNLGLRYRPEGSTQWFLGVHVPKQLQPALLAGEVAGLHLETLQVNSTASRCLPGAPDYLVLRIVKGNGDCVTEIPAALQRARWLRLGLGIAACLLGGGLVSILNVWVGMATFTAGTHLLRNSHQIRCSAAKVFGEHR